MGKPSRDPDLQDPVSLSEVGTCCVPFRDLGKEPRQEGCRQGDDEEEAEMESVKVN